MTAVTRENARRLIGAGVAEAKTSVAHRDVYEIRKALALERAGAARSTMIRLLERELRRRGQWVES